VTLGALLEAEAKPGKMRANSLALRLVLSSAVIACTLLVAAGLLLGALFQQALERNFDQRLQAVMDGLLANVTLKADGTPELTDPIADTRFALAESGWYWQVEPPEESDAVSLVSQSLLNMELDVPDSVTGNVSRFYLRDRKAQQLRAIRQEFKLFGSEKPYAFLVAGNFDELSSEVSSFRKVLYSILGLLGFGLLGATLFQVRFGLRPMQEMQQKLNDIRSGKAERLEGNFPTEMQPVAQELNLLIQSNKEIVDRSRMQVGNLAHALKTPISVLTNEAQANSSPLAFKLREQLDVMMTQVNLYLDRARRAARAQSIGVSCEVEPVLQALARTLQRINRDKQLEISVEAPKDLKFRGERQDLEEMVGNLMENATKWAMRQVKASAVILPASDDGRMWLAITIDDDGPGIPSEKRETALKRGQRLDESKPGSGLGLNIVSETAGMHGGSLELDTAPLGGLRATLRLPTVG
jgi:signal transduction histidine kinase